MTPKQAEYIKYRAQGLGQAQSALKACYATSSAKVTASKLERLPAIRAAITEAKAGQPAVEFDSAQDYLSAVVRGATPPDPVRVGAARALLPFERARQRAPMKGKTPTQLDRSDKQAGDQALLDQWAEKAKAVRARLAQKKIGELNVSQHSTAATLVSGKQHQPALLARPPADIRQPANRR
jgi:hypothetical protein